MSDMNKVFLSGRLTADPERPADGVVAARVASNHVRMVDGVEKKEVLYLSCVLFGRRGVAFADHHKKGDEFLFEGRLRFETWESGGERRSMIKLVVLDWHFKGDRKTRRGAPDTPRGTSEELGPSNSSDDVPF